MITTVEERIRRAIEDATYQDAGTVLNTNFRKTHLTNGNEGRESLGGRAFMAITREEQLPEQKVDFDEAAKPNDRWTTLVDNAETNLR